MIINFVPMGVCYSTHKLKPTSKQKYPFSQYTWLPGLHTGFCLGGEGGVWWFQVATVAKELYNYTLAPSFLLVCVLAE